MIALDITTFFGRLHPLLVHLPIGFIILALIFELKWFRDKGSRFNFLSITWLLAFISSFFSAFIGWSLGPTMTALSDKFMFNRYLKKIGLKSKLKYGFKERIKRGGGFNKDDAEQKVYFLNSNPNEVFDKDSEKF